MKIRHALLFGLPGIIIGIIIPFAITYFTSELPTTSFDYARSVAINAGISCFMVVLMTFIFNKKKMAALFIAEVQKEESTNQR